MIRILIALLSVLLAPALMAGNSNPATPNVLIIYYDDMGWGDMGANTPSNFEVPADSKHLTPGSRSLTPHLDRFAEQGMRFTNGHSADGVCSPSRYALLTGRYCWRTSLKRGVTWGYTPTFIQPDEFTIGKMLQAQGYRTAMVGKWHAGMQFYDTEEKPIGPEVKNDPHALANNRIDLSKPVTDTPYHTAGFDYYFGTTASLDMPPYAWLESKNDQVHVLVKGGVVENGTVDFSQAQIATNDAMEELQNITEIIGSYARPGAIDPAFVFADYLQIQAAKTKALLSSYAAGDEPFFFVHPDARTTHPAHGAAGFPRQRWLALRRLRRANR